MTTRREGAEREEEIFVRGRFAGAVGADGASDREPGESAQPTRRIG